jgi:hypothetical protein
VKARAWAGWLAGAGLCAALTGCSSMGEFSGAAAGVATGIVTANPAVGIGVGIAVQAAADEAIKRYMKGLHRDQQDALARLAGGMQPGQTKAWRVEHDVPLDSGQGQVRVTREFDTALAPCKEFVFSLAGEGGGPDAQDMWFVASACKDAQGWKWASAEPAVARWGSLQ